MLFLMILSVFAGAIAVTWRNLHIRIDTFLDRMPPAARRAALIVGSLISIAVISVITFHSGTYRVAAADARSAQRCPPDARRGFRNPS